MKLYLEHINEIAEILETSPSYLPCGVDNCGEPLSDAQKAADKGMYKCWLLDNGVLIF